MSVTQAFFADLEMVGTRIGHEPVDAVNGAAPDADAAVIEPATPNGLALASSLRARSGGFPLVFVSIYPQRAEAAALAPEAYLQKPFHLAEIEAALRNAFGRLTPMS